MSEPDLPCRREEREDAELRPNILSLPEVALGMELVVVVVEVPWLAILRRI